MHFESEEIVLTIVIGTVLVLFFVVVILFLYLLFQKKKQKYSGEKKLMHSQFQQALLQTQIEIQEQTLKTISEEIHDNIGQVLSLAKLHLNTFPGSIDEATQIKVDDTKQLVGKAINDLRDLSRSLHGEKISEIGLQQAIENELRILQNTKQFETSFSITGTKYRLDPQKEMVLFRIVQESLNNAVKYSKAKMITVQLQFEPALFRLTIADNGIGFNSMALQSSYTGIGLKNMQNRAALIGGKFLILSTPGNGTSITVELEK